MRYVECFIKFRTAKSKLNPTTLLHVHTKKPKGKLLTRTNVVLGVNVIVGCTSSIYIYIYILQPFPTEIQDDLRVVTNGPR